MKSVVVLWHPDSILGSCNLLRSV